MVQAAAVCSAGDMHCRAAVPGVQVVAETPNSTAPQPLPAEGSKVCPCYSELQQFAC